MALPFTLQTADRTRSDRTSFNAAHACTRASERNNSNLKPPSPLPPQPIVGTADQESVPPGQQRQTATAAVQCAGGPQAPSPCVPLFNPQLLASPAVTQQEERNVQVNESNTPCAGFRQCGSTKGATGLNPQAHPDSQGAHLKHLIPLLEAIVQKCDTDWGGGSWGIVWDFLSLPQRGYTTGYDPQKDDRTPYQLGRFIKGLGSINVWYGAVYVTTVVCDWPMPECAQNTVPIDRRGWCIFERRLSSIRKDDDCCLCVSQLSSCKLTGYLSEVRSAGKAGRFPPLAPDDFDRMLREGMALELTSLPIQLLLHLRRHRPVRRAAGACHRRRPTCRVWRPCLPTAARASARPFSSRCAPRAAWSRAARST